MPWTCGETSSRGRGVVGLRGLAPLSFSADGGTSEGEGEIERREWRHKGMRRRDRGRDAEGIRQGGSG